MLTKQQIIDEIKRTASDNEGKPLGERKFKSETGISSWDWGKYWARFGDARREAGFEPNQRNVAYEDEVLNEKAVELIRSLGKLPTYRELHLASVNDLDFPSIHAFRRRYTTIPGLIEGLYEFYKGKDGYQDIVSLCIPVLENTVGAPATAKDNASAGEVYLVKSGRYYKIGMTRDIVRRGSELRIQLPERMDLIHSITTDDPSGIESYSHRRFEPKRMNGEWFDLTSTEVKAFKRWKRIY